MTSPNFSTPVADAAALAGDAINPATGEFLTYEKIPISRLPVKCGGELYIARDSQGYFYAGWYLFTRQPKNSSKRVPIFGPCCYATCATALRYLIDDVVIPFFTGHKGALERVHAWRKEVLPEAAAVAAPVAAPAVVETAPVEAEQGKSKFRRVMAELLAPSPLARIHAEAVAAAFAPAVPVAAVSAIETTMEARTQEIALDAIEEDPHNARTDRESADIPGLAATIAAQGLLQPIVVRDRGADFAAQGHARRFLLIAGWRRWMAHLYLGAAVIEAKVFVGIDDARAEEMALVENLQRVGLNPMEEAIGIAALRERHGYTHEKIAERIGRTRAEIGGMVGLVRLPLAIQDDVRAGRLSKSHARELVRERWVLSEVEKNAADAERARLGAAAKHGHDLAPWLDRGLTRPDCCTVLARWVMASGCRVSDLEAPQAPRAAMEALRDAKLVAEVSDYRAEVDPATAALIVTSSDGALWHLDPALWKQEKKELDAERKRKEEAKAAEAAERVEAARAHQVNLRVADLTTADLHYVSLMGPDARYQAYLPRAIVAEGIDKSEKETVVCLDPEALQKLKTREAELIAADTAAKLPGLIKRATAKLKARHKALGVVSEDLALVIEALQQGWTVFDGRAFAALDVAVPESLDWRDLAAYEAQALVRVMALSAILNTTGGALYQCLGWVLCLKKEEIGLAEYDDALRDRLLAAAASEVFGQKPDAPAKHLAEWVRAHALGLPVAEIARSYGVTEAEVRAAIEAKA